MKKMLSILLALILLIGGLAACAQTAEPEVTPPPPPVETPEPEQALEPEQTPEPVTGGAEWPNWIDESYGPQWWAKPGWGIATTLDGQFWQLDLYFRAPETLLPLAEEMAMTNYLDFARSWGVWADGRHTFPVISAGSMGDLDVRTRIVCALANRLLALRDGGFEIYDTYMAIFSDRGLVFDEITRDIFEELHQFLAENNPTASGLFADVPLNLDLTVQDIVQVFTDRALAEPVDEMRPTLAPVENMHMFRQNPAAFLEAAYLAGTPFYGHYVADPPQSEYPLGRWELLWMAYHIASARWVDPALYAHYADFLAFVAEQELSEGARWLFEFLIERVELRYTETHELFDQ